MSFQLVPKSVTSNDLERRTSPTLRYFTEFGSFGEHYVKVVEDIHRCSAKYLVFRDISFMAIFADQSQRSTLASKI